MRYYCTHFDINYIAHALSLHESLIKYGGEFTLFMFCMDDNSYDHIVKLAPVNAILVTYRQLEEEVFGLSKAKVNRTHIEYFYTCSPAICYYILMKFKSVDLITYLDSDIYFFSSPESLFIELGKSSIGIIEHNFHWLNKRNIVYGKFNVGWINFKNDEIGLSCLKNWLNDCIKWCYQRLEDNKYADQKYLDYWPETYTGVCILKKATANLAIWNIGKYKLTCNGNQVFVNGEKLIFYHFANLKQIGEVEFTSDLSRVFVKTTHLIKNLIYLPYLSSLLKYQIYKIHPKADFSENTWVRIIKKASRQIRKLVFPDTIIVKKIFL